MRFLVLVMLMVMMSGCATSNIGTVIDQSKLSEIKEGETTYSQVLDLLGQPSTVTSNSDGTTVYGYVHSTASVNLIGSSSSSANVVYVTFDANGVVQKWVQSNTQTQF